jgi:hypothetical protein
MPTHFPRNKHNTRKGARYDRVHQRARTDAARRHHPGDPCVRCGYPLGPMGPHLHYDHAETGGYLGFAHARCNLRAGASKGGRIVAAKYGDPRRQSAGRRLAL